MAATKRSPGRPKKAAAEKLGATLPVRMTSAEKADLEAVAASCGLSSADYLRRAAAYCRALGVPLAREMEREVVAEASRTMAKIEALKQQNQKLRDELETLEWGAVESDELASLEKESPRA